jgi:hypothetical protein
MATDDSGSALSFESGRWSQPVDIDGSGNLNAVSCPTAELCVAVDAAGRALSARSS